jgi:hypothetical protein
MVERIRDGYVLLREEQLGAMTPKDRLWAAAIADGVRTGLIPLEVESVVSDADTRGPATVAYLGELLERVALCSGHPR